ncbi:hypothetical protein DVR12_16120 [Chitinophaga silvatica]|uniref:Uncharacterized protein n=1 Tax=Chitinophaga silvatica TaxID=2282649 RepID=A0A3E1Y8E2_9BACT|nr:hypothetical protein [Chitinophaga silvatica]RFS21423.1 hypothetical protein DVR12_16120 [Chitinophaga silvatica]
MATDGVKIIDGDLAHDTYNKIMDLYDGGTDIETIKNELPFEKDDDGFYHEIFVTAYALAFWEIGALTEEILNEVKRVIALGEGVKVWTEECDAKEGKKRQQVLDRFLKKISQPNLKIRKRKKYALVRSFYFQPDDVLTFKLSDNNYYVVIRTRITQYRGECTYDLATVTLQSDKKPTIEEINNSHIIGRTVPTSFDEATIIEMQPDAPIIWEYVGRKRSKFGIAYWVVEHKNMRTIKENLEVIGKIKIRESLKDYSSIGGLTTFADFDVRYKDIGISHSRHLGSKFPLSLLCE